MVPQYLISISPTMHLAEIRDTIARMDFRWDQGFITDEKDFWTSA